MTNQYHQRVTQYLNVLCWECTPQQALSGAALVDPEDLGGWVPEKIHAAVQYAAEHWEGDKQVTSLPFVHAVNESLLQAGYLNDEVVRTYWNDMIAGGRYAIGAGYAYLQVLANSVLDCRLRHLVENMYGDEDAWHAPTDDLLQRLEDRAAMFDRLAQRRRALDDIREMGLF